VHVSHLAQEALTHADAVVVGEAELIMDKVLDDLGKGQLKVFTRLKTFIRWSVAMPRQGLLKSNRYINKGFVQTSRGCNHGCTFCCEPTMYGLRFRYRPIEDIIREIEHIEERVILLNDADFFGTPERPCRSCRLLRGAG